MLSPGNTVPRMIAQLIRLSLLLSGAYALLSLLFGAKKSGRFLVDLFMLDTWYKPVIDAGSKTMDEVFEALAAVSIMWIVIFGMTYLLFKLMRSAAKTDMDEGLEDFVVNVYRFFFWKRTIAKAKSKALEALRLYYSDPVSKAMINRSQVSEDDLPELVDRQAERYDRDFVLYNMHTQDNLTHMMITSACEEIVESIDDYSVITRARCIEQSHTADKWIAARGIIRDPSNSIIFVRSDTDSALFTHIINTINEAEWFVNRIPSGSSKSVLDSRKNLEMSAEALSVSREFYHDDDVPESKTEIIRWALAQVEEGRANDRKVRDEIVKTVKEARHGDHA